MAIEECVLRLESIFETTLGCNDALHAVKLFLEEKCGFDRSQALPIVIVPVSGRGDVNESADDVNGLHLTVNLDIKFTRVPVVRKSLFERGFVDPPVLTQDEKAKVMFAIRDAFYQRMENLLTVDTKLVGAVMTIGGTRNVLIGWHRILSERQTDMRFHGSSRHKRYSRRWN